MNVLIDKLEIAGRSNGLLLDFTSLNCRAVNMNENR